MSTDFDLARKVAIVTGGNGGIGYGIARGLARAGASIVVAARNNDNTTQAVAALQELGVDAIGVTTDVQNEASVQAMVKATVDTFGRVDILVNNAGINVRKAPQDYTLVLGLLTTKHGQLEDAATVEARIHEAATHVPLERLAVSPQCGFASVEAGNPIIPEEQEAKLRLVVQTAQRVWGAAS